MTLVVLIEHPIVTTTGAGRHRYS